MNSRAAKDPAASRFLVRDLKVVNRLGLHARPAALFVKAASRFESDITVETAATRFPGKASWA